MNFRNKKDISLAKKKNKKKTNKQIGKAFKTDSEPTYI